MTSSTVALGDVADYVNGVAFGVEDWGDEGRPIIRIQNLNDPDKPFNRTLRQVGERNLARRGDLLVSWAASLGVYVWEGEEGCINQHIFKVIPRSELIDTAYLRRALEASVAKMEAKVHGATMKHITRDKFCFHSVAGWIGSWCGQGGLWTLPGYKSLLKSADQVCRDDH